MFIVGRARFYAQPSATAAAPAQTLLPDLYDESVDTFFTPQINLRILPNLYTDPDTFFAPKLNLVLKPNLYTDADTFFVPVVSQPAGSQTLVPSLFSDPDTFYSPSLNRNIKPNLYSDVDTFFGPVAKNRNTFTPALFTDPESYFTQVISQGVSDQDLTPFLYSSQVSFFSPLMGDGSEEDLSFSQGGGKQRHFKKLKSSDIESVLHEGDTLIIRYKKGGVYGYADVSEKKVNRLLKSRSPGGFVHKNIVNKHEYRRMY